METLQHHPRLAVIQAGMCLGCYHELKPPNYGMQFAVVVSCDCVITLRTKGGNSLRTHLEMTLLISGMITEVHLL